MFINKPSIVVTIVAGGVTKFPFEFKWYNDSDIKVYHTLEGQAPDDDNDILDPVAFDILSNPSKIGGDIEIDTAQVTLVDGDTITILRTLPVTRTVDYATRGAFTAQQVNADQDYQTYLLLDMFAYSNLFLRSPVAGSGDEAILFPPPSLNEEFIRWDVNGTKLINDVEPPLWRTETEGFRNETEGFRNETEGFRNETEVFRDDSQDLYDNIVTEGDTQVTRVISEGDTQEARVISEGDTQEARVISEGDTQEARVISAGDDGYASSRDAEAEAMTSDSYANESEDVEVKEYYYDAGTDSILFNSLPNTYSSLHWSIKSGQSATGLSFQGTWDASTGAYPTQRPDGTPLDVGDLFIVDTAGTIDSIDWLILDWMIRNVTNDGWSRVPQIVDWAGVQGVPENVSNALSRSGGTMSGQVKGIAPVADEDLSRKDYVDAGANPIGAIIMYSGTVASIPSNWQLCDGTNGTPNMTNSFVMGTNVDAEIGNTQGSNDAVNISHSHTFTGTDLAEHAHAMGLQSKMGTWAQFSTAGTRGIRSSSAYAEGDAITDNESAGTPSGTISTDGVAGTNLNIPQSVKLAYIQRMS